MADTAPTIVRVNIPTFCLENIEGWLLQCEARFELESIVESTERYDLVIAGLPTDIIRHGMNLRKIPPPTNPYEELKSFLLKEYGKRVKKEPVEVIELSDEEEQGAEEFHRADSGDISNNILNIGNREERGSIGGSGGTDAATGRIREDTHDPTGLPHPVKDLRVALTRLSSPEDTRGEPEKKKKKASKGLDQPGSSDISINIRNTTIHVDNRGGRSNIGGRVGTSKTTSEIHRGRGGVGKIASSIRRGRGGRVDKTTTTSRRGRGGVARVASRGGRGRVIGVADAIINSLLMDHLPDLGCDVDISAACGTSSDNNGILGGGDDSGILSGEADNDGISSGRAESKNEGGVDNSGISSGGAESENNGGHVECYLCHLVFTSSADLDLVPMTLLNRHRIYHQQHGY